MKQNPKQAQSLANLRRAALLLYAILLNDSVAQISIKAVKTNPTVLETPLRFVAADSTLFLEGTKLTLPKKIWEYAYHSPTHKLLIRYGKKNEKKQEMVLYDLTKHQIQWTIKSNAVISSLKEKAAILHFLKPRARDVKEPNVIIEGKAVVRHFLGSKIIDANSGRFLRNGETGLWTLKREDLWLSLANDKYSGIHILSGTELWQRPGNKPNGYRRVFEADSGWVYVVANGLQVFNLKTENRWAFETSTNKKDVGKEVGRMVGVAAIGAVLGTLTGTYVIPLWSPNMAHNLCSSPLDLDGRIYFAARDNFFCFERQTGKMIWQNKLTQEFGSLAVSSAGPYMAVIGEGWKYYGLNVTKALPPAVQLFDKNTGKPVASFATDTSDVAVDFRWTNQGAYLLTSSYLYHLDHKLNLLGVRNATTTTGLFIRILDADQSITLRTSFGILSLNNSSLDSLWFKYLGPPAALMNFELSPKLKWIEGTGALVAKGLERKGAWKQDDRMWLLSSKGLAAVDLKSSGKILMEIPFRGTEYEITDDGVLFTFDENRLLIVDLNKIEQKMPAMIPQ